MSSRLTKWVPSVVAGFVACSMVNSNVVVFGQGGQESPPNILLIIADDYGVANLGAYTTGPNAVPGDPPPTPNLDSLAAGGILFRNAWVTPVCSSTRACLYTGRFGFRTGVRSVNGTALDPAETTFPELIAPAGYSNALFGKWHLGSDVSVGGDNAPRVAGWDHFAGGLGGGIGNYYNWSKTVNGVTATETEYATTDNVTDALAWIAQQTQPWTCTVSFNAPHAPFHEPPGELHTFDLDGANSTTLYKAAVQAMDTEIGRLFNGIGAALNNTTVIFIGDNGTPAGVTEEPYIHSKGSIYEGGVHAPMIVSGAGVVGPGRESFALVHAVDVFRTIVELAGVDIEAVPGGPLVDDGRTLIPLMQDPAASSIRDVNYTEVVDDAPADGDYATRNDRYKFIRRSGAVEFYDLQTDPFETADLLAAGQLTSDEQSNLMTLADALVDTLENPPGDLDGDGSVNLLDFADFAGCFGLAAPDATCDAYRFAASDINNDGAVNLTDFSAFAQNFNG